MSVSATVRGAVLIATLGATGGVRADAEALAAIPMPPGAQSRTVALDLVQNGHRVSIATLKPSDSIERTLAFYREAWPVERNGSPGHVEERAGGWSIVSHLADGRNQVVQLRDGEAGVEGYVSTRELVAVEAGPPPEPPMPPGGWLLSLTASVDVGTSAGTSVVSAAGRPGEVAAFYRDQLKRAGWELVSERADAGPNVLLLERPGARLDVVIGDEGNGRSLAVLNEVRAE